MTTSITTDRPGQWQTALSVHTLRHIKAEWFVGYRSVDLRGNQQAFVATPEKALSDLVHLEPGGDSADYLQGMGRLDLEELQLQAELTSSQKLRRAAALVVKLTQAERAYETL